MEVDDEPTASAQQEQQHEEEKEEEAALPLKVDQLRLDAYYRMDYPVDLMERWLGCGKKSVFKRREFVFQKTLLDDEGLPTGKPLMVRYKSFDGANELRKGITSFEPDRIEIGPIYSHQPKLKDKAIGFEPTERELVFDIDASDYDDIRVCCKDKKMCEDCWGFMRSGVKILNRILTHDFGFKHLLWVFSGRRGIHCWVSDETARKLTNEQRASIAKYIEVHLGGKTLEDSKIAIEKDLAADWSHPTFKTLYNTFVKSAFEDIVLNPENQNNLSDEKIAHDIFTLFKSRIPNNVGVLDKVKEYLAKAVSGALSQKQAWEGIKRIKSANQYNRHCEWVPIVVEYIYTYPRLDVMVSTKRNHLLKSPYSIHPGTGLLCVPFLSGELDTFRPFTDAPHVASLSGSALPRVEIFEKYISEIEREREAMAP
eukprot:TRINITY_DN24718_c0_g1_i1.p1 TRINITY_DN24718_c0_g1~~TRINITY_DN24718_c0_g1_i1.p1  ORF type:complete len:426 (+),score=86.61 TRINITY_DN24718_c0_g1_i1:58-1335(+)